jgi:hypothetical protein
LVISLILAQTIRKNFVKFQNHAKADSFKSNKYSVPMAYQRINIAIDTIDSQLHIYDLETGEEVATHTLTT